MMRYSTSATSSKPMQSVLQSALVLLTTSGFEIVDRRENRVDLVGPGLHSSRQNPILGASRIQLRIVDRELMLEAELGGVESMRRFLMIFPFALGLGLGLAFAFLGAVGIMPPLGVGFGAEWVLRIGMGILPVLPWLVISPLIANAIKSRTQRALDVLVRNAVALPNEDHSTVPVR